MKYAIRANYLLTMPEDPAVLAEYDPDGDIEGRDRELTGAIEDGGVLVEDNVIAWVGAWSDRPSAVDSEDVHVIDAGVVTPGWIDCHTHAVFAGERADEFVRRNAGQDYGDILEAGGGILNTVDSVRQSSTTDLAEGLAKRVFESIRRGVTTLEVKSGYGLTTSDELKQLKAIQMVIEDEVPIDLVPCFLGAHAIPREFRDDRDAYVDLVCEEMIPAVAEQGLADYCDVFCDRGAFTTDEAERILSTGIEYDLIPRIHADELSDAGAAQLAVEIGAASADHLEFTPDDVIAQMGDSGVTGVLMPAVNLFLGTTDHMAPARKLLNAGGEVALATDFNPGSAMTQDLGMVLTLGCTLYGLTPGEALRSVTIGAAKALQRDDIGRIREGATANLTLLDVPHPEYVPYHFGESHVNGVVWHGEFVYWTSEEHME
ncbi:MAG: imidazolonepropionase [Myxococcota bacterium]